MAPRTGTPVRKAARATARAQGEPPAKKGARVGSRRKGDARVRKPAAQPYAGGGGGDPPVHGYNKGYGGGDDSGNNNPAVAAMLAVPLHDLASVKLSKPSDKLLPGLGKLLVSIVLPPAAVYFCRGGSRKTDKYFWITLLLCLVTPATAYFGYTVGSVAGVGLAQIHAVLVTLFKLKY